MTIGNEYDLWVTLRCAKDDLGLKEWPDPDGVLGPTHAAVNKFRDLEKMYPNQTAFTWLASKSVSVFHCTSAGIEGSRGMTKTTTPCFLFAYAIHRGDSKVDSYDVAQDLERRGTLYPTNADYDRLEIWRSDRWLRNIRDEVGPMLIDAALKDPEVPQSVELRNARGLLVALPYEERHLLFLRIDSLVAWELSHQQAALIAQAIFQHQKVQLMPSPTWMGDPLPGGCFAFDVIL